MSKRKDNDEHNHEPLQPAKRVRNRLGFRVSRPRASPAHQATASSSTSRITTLTLGASGRRLKAKHTERSHTPAAAPHTAPPPALTPRANSPNDVNLQAEDDHVEVASSIDAVKPTRNRNNNAQVWDRSSSIFFSTV